MAYINLHEKLQQASRMLKEAQLDVVQAQGQDLQLIKQAESTLNQVESELHNAQTQGGAEATENPQFQQAFETLHDVRQQVQEAQQNIKDEL